MCTCLHMPKTSVTCKKTCFVWLKKLQGVWQIARLKQRLLSFTFHKHEDPTRESYVFVISLVQWWKLYYIYIFFTKMMTDFDRSKRNTNNRTIVFLTSLLIALTWNILLVFSFWCKLISCFKQSTVILEKCFGHNI